MEAELELEEGVEYAEELVEEEEATEAEELGRARRDSWVTAWGGKVGMVMCRDCGYGCVLSLRWAGWRMGGWTTGVMGMKAGAEGENGDDMLARWRGFVSAWGREIGGRESSNFRNWRRSPKT
jgi:hypothetical protein